jgi:hypothetical protein
VVDGKRVDKKELKITITPTGFILSIEDQDYGNLENDDSCFAFLTFIKTLILLDHSDLALQKEPQREGLLNYPMRCFYNPTQMLISFITTTLKKLKMDKKLRLMHF